MTDDITDFPLAYLITFRCYGTWLHGDERGSIDRHNRRYGMPKYPKTEHWQKISGDRMKRPPVKLTARMRKAVEKAIRETCKIRNWTLLAINVRTNHVHVVVVIGPKKPGIALNALKANATREMRADGCWTLDVTPWADKGSERYLWNESSVAEAIDYVINRQGDDI
jgi:REP element-mobilizing transposase RayT